MKTMYLIGVIAVPKRPPAASFIIGNWITDQERNTLIRFTPLILFDLIGLFVTGTMTVSQFSISLSSSFCR